MAHSHWNDYLLRIAICCVLSIISCCAPFAELPSTGLSTVRYHQHYHAQHQYHFMVLIISLNIIIITVIIVIAIGIPLVCLSV